jgi:hypothetical protein
MRVAPAAAFLLASAPALAQAPDAERCPALPAESGFEWHYQAGPDFDLCRAESASGGPEFFGMYLGFAANFHPETDAVRENGSVGGHDVVWYAMDTDPAKFPHGRQTLFTLPRTANGYEPQVHVWIQAVTPEQLVQMIRVLENVRFSGSF